MKTIKSIKAKNCIERLREAVELSKTDPERGHLMADLALVIYIDNEEISKLYISIKKYYA